MAKKIMPADQHAKILREAQEVEAVTKLPGWKVIRDEIEAQMNQARDQLAENRLRTIEETITTKEGSQTFITTAETQIAETAGMFKMGKWVLDLVETIINGPSQLARYEKQGLITVEKDKQEQQETKEERR